MGVYVYVADFAHTQNWQSKGKRKEAKGVCKCKQTNGHRRDAKAAGKKKQFTPQPTPIEWSLGRPLLCPLQMQMDSSPFAFNEDD